MLTRLILAVAYGVFVAIVVLIVGAVLVAAGIPILTTLGALLKTYCWAFGLIAGIFAFFGNWGLPFGGPR